MGERRCACGGLPASELSSGTASQSAITSNIEIRMSAPLPVRPRAISASRIAACAVAPVAMSTIGDADARRALRPAGDRGEPALGLDQQIIGLAVGVGAVVAIAGDRAADQRRIILAQPLAAKSRACPSSRASGSAAARRRLRSASSSAARPSLVARSTTTESLPRLSQTK